MLDVHAPEHRISEKRDFFVHLFTITCGLLIALGLENAAEALHHRQQRNEAIEQIQQEIRENLDSVKDSDTTLAKETNDMLGVIHYANDRLAHKNPSAKDLRMSLAVNPLKDAAWRTASATGVAQFIPYAKVEGFADCYKEVDLVGVMQQRLLDSYLGIEAVVAVKDPDEIPDEQVRETLPKLQLAIANLHGTQDIQRGLRQACNAALK